MPADRQLMLDGFETHSVDMIQDAITSGINPNGVFDGKTPMDELIEMYLRSDRFSACVRCLLECGAKSTDSTLTAVLLDDKELLRREIESRPTELTRKRNLRCAFTPLDGATLLHIASEFGLYDSAQVLIEMGADVNAKADSDALSLNGQTPIFHTVCQHRNHGFRVLQLLLEYGAKPDLRLNGITWGRSFPWQTVVFDPTPISYAQAGLFPQFQRSEKDVYQTIELLLSAAKRKIPTNLNVPNEYLRTSSGTD